MNKPNETRIQKKDEWKTSAYSLIPYQTHFVELCGFADNEVEPGRDFGMPPHQNMEISTIFLFKSINDAELIFVEVPMHQIIPEVTVRCLGGILFKSHQV